jgi:hypothetical protein
MAAKVVPPQAGRHGTRLTICATVYGVIASLPIRGRGVDPAGAAAFWAGGSQILRNTGPSVSPAACCRSSRARTLQSSVSP